MPSFWSQAVPSCDALDLLMLLERLPPTVSELTSVGAIIQSQPARVSFPSWLTVPQQVWIGTGMLELPPVSVFSRELKNPQILCFAPRFWSMRKLYAVLAMVPRLR